jgi:broad specificity phosphatase PhoE
MKPRSIFLIRHGESEGNLNKKIYRTVPDWKVPLTYKGYVQARNAGKRIRALLEGANNKVSGSSIRLYTSPWYRARQTTTGIIEGIGCPTIEVREDPRIREQEWGNFQEKHLVKKIKKERHKYGSFFYRMPHGESGADVYDRVTTFIDTLHRDFEKDYFPPYCGIIFHGLSLRVFIMRWFHWEVENFEAHDTPHNCCVIEMALQDNNKYKLISSLPKYPRF